MPRAFEGLHPDCRVLPSQGVEPHNRGIHLTQVGQSSWGVDASIPT